ncbi:MAG: hypothetical protein RLZZ175_515 [Bacteroidota bacterium]|jgi:two-component system, sporulation sensor kinase E
MFNKEITTKSFIRITIAVCTIIIGSFSLYYTKIIVKNLAEREEKMIDLYAKGLNEIAKGTGSENLVFLFQEIIESNNSIPVILTDDKFNVIDSKNISLGKDKKQNDLLLKKEIEEMRDQHEPIVIDIMGIKNYIFYKNSYLLTQLLYYPYIQLGVIIFFVIIAFLALNYSKKSEQNKLWVGLAKETAHQLGTPLSSLIAWIEYFKTMPELEGNIAIDELEKDVFRLEMITSRFSAIGSIPKLEDENILDVIMSNVNYLESRISKKVKFVVDDLCKKDTLVKLNRPLFGWVIENLIKNATDAMNGEGKITIHIQALKNDMMAIDITDTGKGMTNKQIQRVFEAGFTTKKRGWGLGLTLAKRIIENYHQGKIYIKHSEEGKGTTFRIELKAEYNI